MAEGSALSCAPSRTPSRCFTSKMDRSMRAYGEQDFLLAAGDFLFLPRGAGAALRCPKGRRASGFLIKGRVPSEPRPRSMHTVKEQ